MAEASQAGPAEASIAVLPFADMSAEGDQQYLSDGMAEELLNLLAQVPELRVASRTSSFNLRDSGLSVPEMAAQLMVAHILEGSIRMSGGKMRVTVQLIDAASDQHLWSQTYDRGFDDVFAVQDEIARAVLAQLRVEILGEPPTAASIDPQAYDLYLQASHLLKRYQVDNAADIARMLEQAVALEPGFARAWLLLSNTYQQMVIFELLPQVEGLEKSRAALDMAESLEPDSISVLQRRVWHALRWEDDIPRAVAYSQKVVDHTEDPMRKLNRTYDIRRFIGLEDLQTLFCRYRLQEDPTETDNHHCLAETYLELGQCDLAYRHAHTALTLIPDMWGAHRMLIDALNCLGRHEEALKEAKAMTNKRRQPVVLAEAYSGLGMEEEFQATLEQLSASEFPYWSIVARIHAQRGEIDEAFDALAQVDAASLCPCYFVDDTDYQRLHGDPRWQDFLEAVDISEENLARYRLDLPVPQELLELDGACDTLQYKKELYCP